MSSGSLPSLAAMIQHNCLKFRRLVSGKALFGRCWRNPNATTGVSKGIPSERWNSERFSWGHGEIHEKSETAPVTGMGYEAIWCPKARWFRWWPPFQPWYFVYFYLLLCPKISTSNTFLLKMHVSDCINIMYYFHKNFPAPLCNTFCQSSLHCCESLWNSWPSL